MKLILLGAPGAGKGTVAKLLSDISGAVQISTGNILRSEVDASSSLGKEVEKYLITGDLIPDSIIMKIMNVRLLDEDAKNGFLFDGFPRTIPQAVELDLLLAKIGIDLDMVVNLDVSRDIIMSRLTTRRTCSNMDCQAIYNVKSMPSAVEGVCDNCGSQTIQRVDDTPEVINKRLDSYDVMTAPLVEYYKNAGLLLSVKAISSDEIIKTVLSNLKA